MMLIVLIFMNTYPLIVSRNMIFTSKQIFFQNQSSVISTALTAFERLTEEDVRRVIDFLDITGLIITVTNPDGTALYNTVTDEHYEADDVFFTSNIPHTLSGYDVFHSKFSENTFSSSSLTPVVSGGTITGAIYLREYDYEQGAILSGLQAGLWRISILVAALSMVLIVIVLNTIMKRLTKILNAVKIVREGEYSHRIEMDGNDELALLGDEFNSLTGRLQSTDEIRRRFVSDASHELKTPLASIRLLSDSIMQNETMDNRMVREFVNDIGAEAERLARTTEKLLSLTRLDSELQIERYGVDVGGVVVSTLRMLLPLAESRYIHIESKLDDDCFVFATDDDIYQIIFNLTDNAIKYNLDGGSVFITLIREANSVVLTVDDTGIGIPSADLPNIFNRFYRVDKARSRDAGGSGLGLAIAHDMAREHGGAITASARKEGGMRFQVKFPLHVPERND